MMAAADKVNAAIHRYRHVLLALYSVSLLFALGSIAARRYFWYDELFSVLIASLPSGGAIWQALAHGAENQPPLHFWLIHLALPLSGTPELSARIPSILAFWAMTLCLYRIVARETNTTYGFIAMLVPFTAPTVYFAYEARGYALLLVFAAASVLFWQMARSGERRPWSVVMFGLTLAASVYCHSYGVLLFVPFVLTELALGVVEKRWDRQIWLAVALAGVALLPLMPFMLAVGGNTSMFSDPSLTAVQGLYGRLLGFPSAIFLLLTLGAGLLASSRPASPVLSGRSPTILTSRAGTFFLLTFCLLPVVGFFMARLATNAYADRYFVFAVVGFSIAFALMVHQQWRAQTSWLAVWCLLGLVLLATLEIRHHYTVPTYRAGNSVTAAAAVEATRRLPGGNEPFLVSSVFYMPVYYYSAPEVRQRLYFLDEDPTSHFSIAAGRLAAIRPLAIISLAELFEKHSRFYTYMPSDRLLREVRRRSMQISYIDDGLYHVIPTPRGN